MSFSCFNTFQNAALFSKPVNFFFPVTVNDISFISLFVNGYLSLPEVTYNSITNKNVTIAGWDIINGTGTSYYVGNGSTSLYTGTPLPAVSKKYIISVNGDPNGGALSTGNVQTMTQTYQFPSAGIYNLVFYVFSGSVIDPEGTHSVSVYVGGQPILYNYSVGNVPNSAPQVITMPFSVDANNLTLTIGFVFYCANANLSYLGITGMTYFNQTATPYSFLAVDPSGMKLYLPFQSDYKNYASGIPSTSTIITMNGGANIVSASVVSLNPETILGRGFGYLSLTAASQQYLTSTNNTITLSAWSSGMGFSIAGWFYSAGTSSTSTSSQLSNATFISFTGTNGISMNLRYFKQNPILLFTIDPARIILGVPTYNILPNIWNHVVIVIGGTSVDGNTSPSQVSYNLYLNGILLTTAYGPWPNGNYTTQTIGYDSVGNYFNGYIEDIRVYNRALTLNDINVLSTLPANNTVNSSIVDIQSMVMYYPFESGSFTNNYGALSMSSISIVNPNFTIGLGSGFGWTVTGSGTLGTSSGYSFPLPTGITTYVTVQLPATIGSSTTLSQTITYLASETATPYMLSFYAFPCGKPGVKLTVSIGNMILLNRVSFGLNARTADTTSYNFVDPNMYNIVDPIGMVMYYSMDFTSTVYNIAYNYADNTFTLPFLFTGGGEFPIVFKFTNESGASSILGITGVKISTITSGSGYTAIDNSNLALYYPLDMVSSSTNYATGSEVVDSVLVNGATVSNINNINANGCLSLVATDNQYMSMGSWTPPKAAMNAGMSFTGWFYVSVGITQKPKAVLFSLAGGLNGAQIQCVYNTFYGCLEFISNGNESIVQDYTAGSYKLIPGSWYFLAYTILSTNNVGTGAIHTYYLNDSCMNQIINSAGTWIWPVGLFSTNTLGTSLVWCGSFSGYLDDFRVYNRALSAKDIAALWVYGYNSITGVSSTNLNGNYGDLLDPSGLQIYYPFNQGTGIY